MTVDGGVLHMDRIDLSWGHMGRPDRPGGPGAVNGRRIEAHEVGNYLLPLVQHLHGTGVVSPHVHADGTLTERQRRASGRIYAACHVNAGGGDYAILFYDYRSRHGERLCQHVATEMRTLPELRGDVRIMAARPSGAGGLDEGKWLDAPWATIRSVGQPVSICIEPYFIDNPRHDGLSTGDGPLRLGEAIARGFLAFLT